MFTAQLEKGKTCDISEKKVQKKCWAFDFVSFKRNKRLKIVLRSFTNFKTCFLNISHKK